MLKATIAQKFSLKEQRGQSMIIMAFSFVAIVFMLGLALDLGLLYIERVSLKRAIDASVLSGVLELPEEQLAAERVIEYLTLNGYAPQVTRVYFTGCYYEPGQANPINEKLERPLNWDAFLAKEQTDVNYWNKVLYHDPVAVYGTAVDDIEFHFIIHTQAFQSDPDNNVDICDTDDSGDANKIQVFGRSRVAMNFMRLVGGWRYINVGDVGTAQNIDRLDVVVVIDKSGSMEFDPVCYGCWKRFDQLEPTDPLYKTRADLENAGNLAGWYSYPNNGVAFPVGWSLDIDTDEDLYEELEFRELCGVNHITNPLPLVAAQTVYTGTDNFHYMILEAELFSHSNSVFDNTFRGQNRGFWALQRGEGNLLDEYADGDEPYFPSKGTSIDTLPAHMGHFPVIEGDNITFGKRYTLAEAEDGQAPGLEYDFVFRNDATFSWGGGDASIWARVHAGRGIEVDNPNRYGDPDFGSSDNGTAAFWGVVSETDLAALGKTFDTITFADFSLADVPLTNQGTGTDWEWVRLGDIPINVNERYRLYFYAGSPGFSIDRIVITDKSTTPLPEAQLGDNDTYASAEPATPGSAFRAACDPCNAIYGHNIGLAAGTGIHYVAPADCPHFQYTTARNNRLDPLFDEWESPMRTAKEAVKQFATSYDTESDFGLKPERDQIGFVAYSAEGDGAGVRTELECIERDPDCDPEEGGKGYEVVLADIESVYAEDYTNIADGMKNGLEVLGLEAAGYQNGDLGTTCNGGTCARGNAKKVMIVLTDGVPNQNPGGSCTGGPEWPLANDAHHRCVLYFAEQAGGIGVTTFFIGLGFGAEQDFLKEAAELGGGKFFFTSTGEDLNFIFGEILSNIYVRLTE